MCRHGTAVSLVVYPLEGDEPLVEIPLDPRLHRTGDHWHIQVAGLPPSFRYGWRVDGPIGAGHRYDPRNVLLDPATPAISDGAVWGHEGVAPGTRAERATENADGKRKAKNDKRKADGEEKVLAAESSGTLQVALRAIRSALPASRPAHPAYRAGL